ncbi:MAG: PfkB family carbohydrate kinase [Bacteroidales bacterium]|nr:PfkB family carbohydrate kinase [Bacteroidales bacterium]
MLDICCIGHITLDKIVTPAQEVYMPGGTSFYFSYGINSLFQSEKASGCQHRLSYKLVTSLAESEMNAVKDMRGRGIDVEVIPSRYTVNFENIYGENQNERKQRVRHKADPFTVEKLKEVEARYIVLGTLLPDDFSLDVIKYLHTRGTLVVDAQGFLRDVRGEEVYPIDWDEKREALKYVDVLKVNEYEAEVLTGESDLHKAAQQLADWGVKEVLLSLGSFGSIILADGVFYDIPAFQPLLLVDATGCGDTYTMGYIYRRAQGATVEEAGRFAAAVSTIKLEHSGPFSSSYHRAMELVRQNTK